MAKIDFERTRESILAFLEGAEPHGQEHQTAGVMIGICEDATRRQYAAEPDDSDAFSRGFVAWTQARGLLRFQEEG